ncbi:uncharacterized protein SPPG_01646 [Spizellomyces punctatus DAOM BR117]|uniref:UBR-type domain-containing protein n=1 Tax=Spizellomyces punctatus (strain DAOM BR117) TaxID=645134 RepID=A0A0L0HSX8_SPIPD|nr:uncharacterized protein SPPG_01646 [Spizellomyces punctatus DAOM BR117]KND04213.1 hypothetical protein SPPG_01646 [Spizellomyces punctatus DAOM BR117]|eukprot:XP_016612252.1 hypothetical protein SPPG_01646 [Spizellomyces punctatus DAOM BR117]
MLYNGRVVLVQCELLPEPANIFKNPMAETKGDDTNTITAVDYLLQQEQLVLEASEVLPGVIDRCSFNDGYLRQKVYACKTCQASGDRAAGVCYGCFVSCHTTHEVVELFYKRHFRCDCGTAAMPGKCSLQKKDGANNVENTYNHNFAGEFCYCNTPYDPETEEGTMYQCIICEDWMHDRCIGKDLDDEVYSSYDYICRNCVSRLPFIRKYFDCPRFLFMEGSVNEETKVTDPSIQTKRPRHDDDEHVAPSKRLRLEAEATGETLCLIADKEVPPVQNASVPDLFCKEGWREELCQCKQCQAIYIDENVSFITLEEETFEPEEDLDADESIHDMGLKRLNSMDREMAINGVLAYQKMKEDLKNYLKTFAESKQTVTADDIRQYFADKLEERKAKS